MTDAMDSAIPRGPRHEVSESYERFLSDAQAEMWIVSPRKSFMLKMPDADACFAPVSIQNSPLRAATEALGPSRISIYSLSADTRPSQKIGLDQATPASCWMTRT